jgi:Flp pilus assembly protein TadD
MGISAALAGCGASSAPQPQPSESVLLGAGSTEFRHGDYNAAGQLFQQAITRDPGDATAYYDLGTTYQAENRVRPAVKEYRLALRYNPSLVPAIFNEATIESVHDVPLAIFLYHEAISLQPNSPTAYLNLGLLEAQQGERAFAGVTLRKALQLDESLRARIPRSVAPDLTLPPPKTTSRAK